MEQHCSAELDRSLRLVEAVTQFAGEPMTAAYLRPESDGLRLFSDSPRDVLHLMNESPWLHTAMGNLETPSGKLLGFAFHPSDRPTAERLSNNLEPSFVVETDAGTIELIYLVEGTNEEISAVRTAIDGEGEDCRTSGMFLLPFKGGRLSGPCQDAFDESGVLKFCRSEAIREHLPEFRA